MCAPTERSGVVAGMDVAGRGHPPRTPKTYLVQVWVPGVTSAPGPGNPVVESIEFVPVAGMQKIATTTPFPTFG